MVVPVQYAIFPLPPPLRQMSPAVPESTVFAVVPSVLTQMVYPPNLAIAENLTEAELVPAFRTSRGIAVLEAVAFELLILTRRYALVLVDADDTLKAVPVVRAEVTIELPMPVVRAEYVWSTCVPATEAVDERSSRTPVVVPVSIEVDVIRNIEFPAPSTEVVCERFSNVDVPATKALLTSLTVSPVVVFTPVTPNAFPEPVVDEPRMLTSEPVYPVVTPD